MNVAVFDIALALGWAMVTAGALLANIPCGLIVGGVLLLGLTFASAWLGGVYARRKDDG
ncbi:MAG TPA: hypothetical protein VFK00_06390 [Rhodanobacteraceae bacterium]|nr:hypothetical protein [Rhodanobacteraceae bacterium]